MIDNGVDEDDVWKNQESFRSLLFSLCKLIPESIELELRTDSFLSMAPTNLFGNECFSLRQGTKNMIQTQQVINPPERKNGIVYVPVDSNKNPEIEKKGKLSIWYPERITPDKEVLKNLELLLSITKIEMCGERKFSSDDSFLPIIASILEITTQIKNEVCLKTHHLRYYEKLYWQNDWKVENLPATGGPISMKNDIPTICTA